MLKSFAVIVLASTCYSQWFLLSHWVCQILWIFLNCSIFLFNSFFHQYTVSLFVLVRFGLKSPLSEIDIVTADYFQVQNVTVTLSITILSVLVFLYGSGAYLGDNGRLYFSFDWILQSLSVHWKVQTIYIECYNCKVFVTTFKRINVSLWISVDFLLFRCFSS